MSAVTHERELLVVTHEIGLCALKRELRAHHPPDRLTLVRPLPVPAAWHALLRLFIRFFLASTVATAHVASLRSLWHSLWTTAVMMRTDGTIFIQCAGYSGYSTVPFVAAVHCALGIRGAVGQRGARRRQLGVLGIHRSPAVGRVPLERGKRCAQIGNRLHMRRDLRDR